MLFKAFKGMYSSRKNKYMSSMITSKIVYDFSDLVYLKGVCPPFSYGLLKDIQISRVTEIEKNGCGVYQELVSSDIPNGNHFQNVDELSYWKSVLFILLADFKDLKPANFAWYHIEGTNKTSPSLIDYDDHVLSWQEPSKNGATRFENNRSPHRGLIQWEIGGFKISQSTFKQLKKIVGKWDVRVMKRYLSSFKLINPQEQSCVDFISQDQINKFEPIAKRMKSFFGKKKLSKKSFSAREFIYTIRPEFHPAR